MESRPLRGVLAGLGVAAVVVGGIWIGQGLGFIPGSFMTGDRTWFAIGIVVAVIGVVLVVVGVRGRRPR